MIGKVEMTGKVELITPHLAELYLALSGGNRSIRPQRLAMYCRDRIAGNWRITHQGIVFDWNNVLRDGHHRLSMICKTGLHTEMFVVRGMDPAAAIYIDAGLPRGARDAFSMAGMGEYSEALVSTARCFRSMPSMAPEHVSKEELHQTIEEYAEGLTFSCSHLNRVAGVSRASRALVARAYYHADRTRLEEFCNVMKTGITTSPDANQDSGAVVFYRHLMNTRKNAGQAMEVERYRKGQSCLQYFLARIPMTKVYGTDEDIYPVI